jgi:hypothetical protein
MRKEIGVEMEGRERDDLRCPQDCLLLHSWNQLDLMQF